MLLIYVYKSFSTMLEEEHQMGECLAFCEQLDLFWLHSYPLWFTCTVIRKQVLNDHWLGETIWRICLHINEIFIKCSVSALKVFIVVLRVKLLCIVIKYYIKVVSHILQILKPHFYSLIHFWKVCFQFSVSPWICRSFTVSILMFYYVSQDTCLLYFLYELSL